jgi:hypothetical protein
MFMLKNLRLLWRRDLTEKLTAIVRAQRYHATLYNDFIDRADKALRARLDKSQPYDLFNRQCALQSQVNRLEALVMVLHEELHEYEAREKASGSCPQVCEQEVSVRPAATAVEAEEVLQLPMRGGSDEASREASVGCHPGMADENGPSGYYRRSNSSELRTIRFTSNE